MAMAAERPMEIAIDEVARTYTLPIVVRNSFIDVEDKSFETDPRRSTSEPPSCRNRDHARTPTRIEMFGDGSTTSGSPRDSTGSDFASEEQSHQGSPIVESASPSFGLNPNAPVWNPTWSPMLSPAAAPTSPSIAPVFFPMPGTPSQNFMEPSLGVPPPPPPPPLTGPTEQYPTQVSSQSRLNANAKAWQPSSMPVSQSPPVSNQQIPAMPPPPPAPSPSALTNIPEKHRKQLQALLDNVQQAFAKYSSIASVDVFDASGTWGRGPTICAWMRAEDYNTKEREQVLKDAKDLILKIADRSESIYVLGYQQKPFSYTDNGFQAMLGGMHDDTKACWDVFAKGCCRREQANLPCRWQHPVCQLPINIEIRQARDR